MTIQPAHSADQAVELLKRDGELLNRYYARVLGRLATAPRRLVDAIEYSLMAGGKRLRPALILESYRAVMRQNAPDKQAPLGANETEPFPPSPLAAAGAMELIHTFSLVHDDLPAMDDDDLRRGRPTNHKVFGEAMAILAGDAMTTMAFELIATDADPSLAPALIRELARASGPEGMVGGQVLDIDGENQKLSLEQLQCLHRLKTGALLVCSCRMGAICARADAPTLEAIEQFGGHLGLAFQIIDDVLDETATPEQMGKATRKDAARGKNTYPSLVGIDRSRQMAQEELDSAMESLQRFGPAADGLRAIASLVVERRN